MGESRRAYGIAPWTSSLKKETQRLQSGISTLWPMDISKMHGPFTPLVP